VATPSFAEVGVTAIFLLLLAGVVAAIVLELRLLEDGPSRGLAVGATVIVAIITIATVGRFSGMFSSATTERLLKGALSKAPRLGAGDEDSDEAQAAPKKSSSTKKLPEGKKPRPPAAQKKPRALPAPKKPPT
jgi:hypothetical protein